jgi:hypothetical protein
MHHTYAWNELRQLSVPLDRVTVALTIRAAFCPLRAATPPISAVHGECGEEPGPKPFPQVSELYATSI